LRLAQANEAGAYHRLLILIELRGGNDSLNAVVPYANPAYYALRPRIAVKRDQVLQLDERTGLHPALLPLLDVWRAGELAVIQGLGYPQPVLSHFRSSDIWQTASESGEVLADGWLARAFSLARVPAGFAADGVVIGDYQMGPLAGRGTRAIALRTPKRFARLAPVARSPAGARNEALAHLLDVERNIERARGLIAAPATFKSAFPASPFGVAVRSAAELAANRAGVAAVHLALDGFDTHRGQPHVHARLLGELADGIAALRHALIEIGRWDSTLIMTYAEFGRHPRENSNQGTDHGTASAQFVTGGRVRGGILGSAPRLQHAQVNNLASDIDFRALYATVLEKWWRIDSTKILKRKFESLDCLRA
jgi:uncharacterized protein (DUF1501 family)